MPEPGEPTAALRRQLLRQGLPRRYVARVVQELDEHREDLEREACLDGLSRANARAAAEEKLGDVRELAKALVAARRRAYWSGRHPIVSFVLLPLPVFPLLFLGLLFLGAKVSGALAWSENRDSLPEPNWAVIRFGFYAALGMALAATAGLTWCLARRSHCGLKWARTGCAVVFSHALLFHAGFEQPHGADHGYFWIGYRLGGLTLPELIAWTVPLLLFALFYFHSRRERSNKTAE
jgi:hypothetical protein